MQSLPVILRVVFALAIVAVVLALGFRPALKLLAARMDAPPSEAQPQLEMDSAQADRLQIASPDETSGDTPLLMPGADAGPSELVRVSSVVGGVSRQRIGHATVLAAQRPDETLRTVKGWLVAKG